LNKKEASELSFAFFKQQAVISTTSNLAKMEKIARLIAVYRLKFPPFWLSLILDDDFLKQNRIISDWVNE